MLGGTLEAAVCFWGAVLEGGEIIPPCRPPICAYVEWVGGAHVENRWGYVGVTERALLTPPWYWFMVPHWSLFQSKRVEASPSISGKPLFLVGRHFGAPEERRVALTQKTPPLLSQIPKNAPLLGLTALLGFSLTLIMIFG